MDMVYMMMNENGQTEPVQLVNASGVPQPLDANDPLVARLNTGPGSGRPVRLSKERNEFVDAVEFTEYHYIVDENNKVIPILPGNIVHGEFEDEEEEDDSMDKDLQENDQLKNDSMQVSGEIDHVAGEMELSEAMHAEDVLGSDEMCHAPLAEEEEDEEDAALDRQVHDEEDIQDFDRESTGEPDAAANLSTDTELMGEERNVDRMQLSSQLTRLLLKHLQGSNEHGRKAEMEPTVKKFEEGVSGLDNKAALLLASYLEQFAVNIRSRLADREADRDVTDSAINHLLLPREEHVRRLVAEVMKLQALDQELDERHNQLMVMRGQLSRHENDVKQREQRLERSRMLLETEKEALDEDRRKLSREKESLQKQHKLYVKLREKKKRMAKTETELSTSSKKVHIVVSVQERRPSKLSSQKSTVEEQKPSKSSSQKPIEDEQKPRKTSSLKLTADEPHEQQLSSPDDSHPICELHPILTSLPRSSEPDAYDEHWPSMGRSYSLPMNRQDSGEGGFTRSFSPNNNGVGRSDGSTERLRNRTNLQLSLRSKIDDRDSIAQEPHRVTTLPGEGQLPKGVAAESQGSKERRREGQDRIQYDWNFLRQLQFEPESLQRPASLPCLPEIVLDNISCTQPVQKLNVIMPSVRNDRHIHQIPPRKSHNETTPPYTRPTPGLVIRILNTGSTAPRAAPVASGPSRAIQRRPMHQKEQPPPRKVMQVSLQLNVQLHTAENAWKPVHKKDVPEADLLNEELYRRVRGILNKLTPQKFQTLIQQVYSLEINTEERLKGCIDLVFEKAISEPNFSVAYANMAKCLINLKVATEENPNEMVTFRKLLLNRCQREFEKDKLEEIDLEKIQTLIDSADTEETKKLLVEQKEKAETKAKKRSLGNIRFIGELYKLKMLTENIMHDCIIRLLKYSHNEDNLECLSRLLATIGQDIDNEKSKGRVDQYIGQLRKIIDTRRISARIMFMLQDLLELRKNGWVPHHEDNKLKTIDQIYKDAEQEQQVLFKRSSQEHKGLRRPRTPCLSSGSVSEDAGWRAPSAQADPARMMLTKHQGDENIQLGSGGRPGYTIWQRGSSGGGSRTPSLEREKPPRHGDKTRGGNDKLPHGKGLATLFRPSNIIFAGILMSVIVTVTAANPNLHETIITIPDAAIEALIRQISTRYMFLMLVSRILCVLFLGDQASKFTATAFIRLEHRLIGLNPDPNHDDDETTLFAARVRRVVVDLVKNMLGFGPNGPPYYFFVMFWVVGAFIGHVVGQYLALIICMIW